MKIGLFDHLERSVDRPLAQQFDERLEFVTAADQAEFYCLHVAEHHSSPLNMVPAPSIYLSAVARATKNIRMGALVYLLTLCTPLRLAEEICMLDHLSKGRLEVGVGRGVSPFELNFHKIDHDDSRNIFIDAYQCLTAALTGEEFSYSGKYFDYAKVPMALRPLQKPHPPFWYGSSNKVGATWAGQQGIHLTANGSTSHAKENIDAYRQALKERGGPEQSKEGFKGGAVIGQLRHIYVAETDAEAKRIAKPALEHHARSLNWLRKRYGNNDLTNRNNIHRGQTFESWQEMEMVIAGSPATVTNELIRQVKFLGVNYLLAYLFFGSMTLKEAMNSFALFTKEVAPKLRDL